jgi:hypothetical protein
MQPLREDIGNWCDNCDNIQKHCKICTGRLQASFKRMSVEELGRDGARKDEHMEKDWPLLSDQDRQCYEWL